MMLRSLATGLTLLLALQTLQGQGSFLIDQRRFATDRWLPADTGWHVSDTLVTIDTRSYDQLLAYRTLLRTGSPWTLTVELRGARAGIFFGLGDTLSKRASHMVRFDGRSLLSGWFNGGGLYTATHTFAVLADPSQWTTLKITVDPVGGWYDIAVNGIPVGRDTLLVFRSGYVGLQASDGAAAFHSFVVSSQRSPKDLPAPAVGTIPTLDHVQFVERHGPEVCAYLLSRNAWITMDRRGRTLRVHRSSSHPQPQLSAVLKGRRYSVRGNLIDVRDARGRRVDSLTGRFSAPEALLATSQWLLVSDPGIGAVLEYDARGIYRRTHRAAAVGGFRVPGGMVLLPSGEVAVADHDRVVLLRPGVDDPEVRIERERNGTTVVRRKDRTALKIVETVSGRSTGRVRSDGSVAFSRVDPLTSVQFRCGPMLAVVPPTMTHSAIHTFTTPPAEPDRMAVRRLRLLYLVYRTIDYRDVYPGDLYPQVPDGRSLNDDDIEYLRQAAQFNREFYFRNSSCRLALDIDMFVIDDTLHLRDVGDRDPYWLEPGERVTNDFERACRSLDARPGAYAGVLCTYAWLNYPARRTSALRDPSGNDSIRIRQAVGGGTYGVPAPWKYGANAGYTGNPFQDRLSRQDWLITHEFHHQLDALMDQSGYSEYDHADEPWKMPGRFGEDFDFNAHILRRADPSEWLDLRFGTLVSVLDRDHDGVPDDDPTLPLDERRMGSSPQRKDTDGDGASDLRELTAGTSHGSSPLRRDTDRDGITDGRDPEPLVPFAAILSRRVGSSIPVFATDTLGGIATELRMGWTPETLFVEVRTSLPVNVLFQLDANNDGWFHGFDNLQMRIVQQGDSVVLKDAYLRDCSSWVDSPRDRRDLFTPADVNIESLRARMADAPAASREIVRVAIPRRAAYGMEWKRGKRVAIRFGIQRETDLWVWNELFERNSMMSVELR